MKSPRTRPSTLVGQWFGSAWGTPIFSPQTAPTSLSAIPTNTNVAISFTPPSNDGGSAITNYEYSFNNSTWTALSPADITSPITVSGLTQNTAYTIYLRAVNTVGSGPGSTGVSFTTEGVPTGTATITSITSITTTTATVNFTVAAGGGAITGYDLYVTHQTNSWNNTTASPISVTGLTPNTTFTFFVRAKNAYGVGPGSAGVNATTLAAAPSSVEYLVIAGGGGGSGKVAGGGGAGGMRTSSLAVSAATAYTVTVAGGGAGGTIGTAGGNSVFSSITSTGGGRGANVNPAAVSSSGGSGGGGASYGGYGTYGGSSGIAGQGNSGGAPIVGSPVDASGGGGGGGAGGAGGSPNGGSGAASSITGTSITRAGGGGGSRYFAYGAAGAGGAGGGGAGSTYGGGAGSTNTGGGGGGGWLFSGGNGGAGGSGIVIIAYPSTFPAITSIGAGLTYSVSTVSRAGYRVYTFTSGTGTITF